MSEERESIHYIVVCTLSSAPTVGFSQYRDLRAVVVFIWFGRRLEPRGRQRPTSQRRRHNEQPRISKEGA